MNTRCVSLLMLIVLGLSGVALAGPVGEPEKVKVVVPGVHAHKGVDPGAAEVLTDLVLEALLTRHGVRALGPPDVRTILTAEQQRVLVGCQDEACFADLAGALGADWLVAGTLGRLGKLYVLSLQLIDPREARVTARTSTRFDSLEKAPEAIGPLVDKLLGQRGRVKTPAALAEISAKPAREAWKVDEYCQRMKAYFDRLEARAYGADVLAARRDLLEDLVLTPFFQQFDHKTNCFWQHSAGATSRLRSVWIRSEGQLQADDVRRRMAEAATMHTQIKLLEEAVPRHLEMEKLGTGRRLTKVPFPVEAASVPRPARSPKADAYLEAFRVAEQVIAKALAAKDRKAFGALFASDIKKSKVDSFWRNLNARRKQGYELAPCGDYLLRPDEVERNAEYLAKRERVRGCLKRWNDSIAMRRFPELVKSGDGWALKSWE